MEDSCVPEEVEKLLEKVTIKKEVAERIWKKDSSFLLAKSTEYNIVAIKKYIEQEDKEWLSLLMECSIETIVQSKTIENMLNYLLSTISACFEIDAIIKGNDYISSSCLKKIGINSHMEKKDGKYLTYAACHHCYEKVVHVPSKYIVYSPCYRIEEYYNEYRRKKFNMFEIVAFDLSKNLDLEKYKYILFLLRILKMANIKKCKVTLANDSFITDNNEKLLYQMLSKSKIEIKVYSKKIDEYVSVASINMHYKNFIRKFAITDKIEYESMCFGIGIERLISIIKEYN